MNKLDLTKLGGYPLALDDIAFNDDAYRHALNNIFRSFGDNFILFGCQINGTTVSAGYVMLNGELLRVDEHQKTGNYFEKVSTFDPAGHLTTQDGPIIDVYVKYRATCTANASNLAYNGDRIGFGYTKAETDQRISAIVNGAPGALDTLYELANALGNDAHLSTTLLNAIANEATSRNNADTALSTAITNLGLYNQSLNSKIDDVTALTKQKCISIGAWNIRDNRLTDLLIPHGVDGSKIIDVRVRIRDDSSIFFRWGLNYTGMKESIDYTGNNIVLNAGNWFVSPIGDNFVSTSFNRGIITIQYQI